MNCRCVVYEQSFCNVPTLRLHFIEVHKGKKGTPFQVLSRGQGHEMLLQGGRTKY